MPNRYLLPISTLVGFNPKSVHNLPELLVKLLVATFKQRKSLGVYDFGRPTGYFLLYDTFSLRFCLLSGA